MTWEDDMRILARVAASVTVLAVGGWLLLGGSGRAGEGKDPRESVEKIAQAFEKGDHAAAKSQAEALAKSIEELGDVMDLMKPRKPGKKVFGVGKTPGAIKPDGIELKLIDLSKEGISKADLGKESDVLRQMAYRAAAITQVALVKPADTAKGAKLKLWNDSGVQARDGVLELAKAIKSGNPDAVQKAAAKAVTGCNNCHGEFR
jgi:hypothetical protein